MLNVTVQSIPLEVLNHWVTTTLGIPPTMWKKPWWHVLWAG